MMTSITDWHFLAKITLSDYQKHYNQPLETGTVVLEILKLDSRTNHRRSRKHPMVFCMTRAPCQEFQIYSCEVQRIIPVGKTVKIVKGPC